MMSVNAMQSIYVKVNGENEAFYLHFFQQQSDPGKLLQGVAGGSGGRGLCHRWHCGSFGWELGGFGIGVGGCVLASRSVNYLAKNLIYSLLENTTIGKICVSFLQIGGSESD